MASPSILPCSQPRPAAIKLGGISDEPNMPDSGSLPTLSDPKASPVAKINATSWNLPVPHGFPALSPSFNGMARYCIGPQGRTEWCRLFAKPRRPNIWQKNPRGYLIDRLCPCFPHRGQAISRKDRPQGCTKVPTCSRLWASLCAASSATCPQAPPVGKHHPSWDSLRHRPSLRRTGGWTDMG